MTTSPPDRDECWLTVAEVAARLRVDPDTVRRWIATGELHAISLGSRRAGYRVAPDDLRRFLDARRTAVGQPGKPLVPTYRFTHHGGDERARPKTAVALKHEQDLYTIVRTREDLAHQCKKPYEFDMRDGPDQLPLAPVTPEIRRLLLTTNTVFCPYCGELSPETALDWHDRVILARCQRCAKEWQKQYFRPGCRPECNMNGGGIGLGTPLETHPRSLKRGRIRSAYGMSFCFDCDLGILYRWDACQGDPQITLIHWLTRFHRISLTQSPRDLVRL